MKQIKIALVGQPNVGKSMLTNAMGDTTLHVGNFSGVTVEKKEIKFKYKDYLITIVDLPGTYMLTNYSMEEKVTSDFLKNEEYDLILNVADSTNLERNLQLTSELLNLDKKMLLALNMSDEAKKEKIEINSKLMEELMGISITKVSAVTKEGVSTLLQNIVNTYENEKRENKLIFSEAIEEEIRNITEHLEENKYESEYSYRKIAIDLISENKQTYKKLHDEPIWITLQTILLDAIKHIQTHNEDEAMIDIFAEEYMSFNKGILLETVKVNKLDSSKITTTQKIDNILIHPFLGIPIFLFLMWGLFQLTFEVGSIPMDWIDAFFGWLGDLVGATIVNDDLRSLVVDGIIGGVGAVVLFVPNIIILFVGIALLEGTGYMSRVAYLLDGFFHKFGLHGQSFIPLVTGFGCSIPAYMGARILKNDRDRLLTLFIIGFMSCGARLPVYVLFIGAFFEPQYAGNALFAIYISGAILGILLAKVLKMTAFKGENEPFVMEMPKYRLPSAVLIWHTVKIKTLMYLKKAGTFIAAASILVWFLSNYPKNEVLTFDYQQQIAVAQESQKDDLSNLLNEKLLEQSYLGQVGKFIEPIFEPLGMDWKMAVALQTGLAAKEVVVSTLGVLYSLGGDVDEENSTLQQRLSDHIPFASAVAFIVIMMTYLPCLAATVVFSREAGGFKYVLYLFAFTTTVAYSFAFIAYKVALLF
ncbi:ferrous iron transport protein B [Poseidonibacter antarcticus]|uniref:ferrous iron transport protein B n=1 Tax=Poseidonibacter antarcticus TaxID=2478538 RepID=UPI000EF4D56A|nr:ferrous iron transport protein B [Poseidonibacter antarcticus]